MGQKVKTEYLLGIDPGQRTGWALLCYEQGKTYGRHKVISVGTWKLDYERVYGGEFNEIKLLFKEFTPQVRVFIEAQRQPIPKRRPHPEVNVLAGVLAGLASCWGMPVEFVNAHDTARYKRKYKMIIEGIWAQAEEVKGKHLNSHERDAIVVALVGSWEEVII